MHIHILGICGTFMGGIAVLAKQMGHKVTGSDANVYPPMSTQLEQQGIELMQGYMPEHFEQEPDLVIVGNVVSRGNPAMEYVLDKGIRYTSGPEWLSEAILQDKWVLAVAGTHGKTTTSSMLTWILQATGYQPSFLIGGVPENIGVSARLTDSPFFVIEADEYDTAFFDKRSKFVHYRPRTLILNNLEFDHADIFADLAAIETQFHHLMRTLPGIGQVIYPATDVALNRVIERGCWSEQQKLGNDWQIANQLDDGSQFDVVFDGKIRGRVDWQLIGQHNVDNGLAAIAAARHIGVEPELAIEALNNFKNPKRRMELKGEAAGIRVYDDFAHHPTAIATTLAGLRARVGEQPIIAVLDPRSNTMKAGVHKSRLAQSLKLADQVIIHLPDMVQWSLADIEAGFSNPVTAYQSVEQIVQHLVDQAQSGQHILIMSNGGFDGIHGKLLEALSHGK